MIATRHAALAFSLIMGAPAVSLAQPAAPAAPAQSQPGRGQAAMFERIDANRDGRVTFDEVWVFVQSRFGTADRDRSGGLTQEEMNQAMRELGRGPRAGAPGAERAAQGAPAGGRGAQATERMASMFRMLDADRDGQVTLVEIRPLVEARFRALDANGDNAVERSEMPQRQAHHHHHHRGPGRGGPAAPANPG